ncbi:Cadmium resistance transporter [Phytophthora palmivora]|uniref:Cadmium resistance transporter n=1 Tax=Phytophthora palmivora TaxID=4796 RepID=A0A2P4XW63_9STRA|nr:Cadmium resistance transporter [Phytophthora palmivora]
MGLWGVIASAVVMFATTNIDDALVLVVYFANAAEGKDGLKARHIWIGQLLGFSIIMILSLIGTFVGSFLPPHYSGLLGFVPLLMGLWRMRVWCKKEENRADDSERDCAECHLHHVLQSESSSPSSDVSQRKVTRDVSPELVEEGDSDYHLHELVETPTCEEPKVDEVSMRSSINSVESEIQSHGLKTTNEKLPVEEEKMIVWWSSIFSIQSVKVMAVSLANGGDNVAVYIPALVPYNIGEILVTLAIFYILLVVWVYVAFAFVSFRVVADFIEKFGDYIIPVALVLLGVYILYSTEVLALVCSSC